MTPFSLQHGGLGRARYRDAEANLRTLLFHGNGADASTTFVDSGPLHCAATRVGNPEIKTDSGAFGGAAMRYYQGAGSYVYFTNASGFLTSADWTIELIVEPVEDQTGLAGSGTNYSTIFGLDNNGSGWQRMLGTASPPSSGLTFFGTVLGPSFAAGTGRRYIMISRTASGKNYYVDGTRVGTGAAGSLNTHTKAVVGCINEVISNSNYSHGARIEEVRLTNGRALQTGASYTVQTEAFPDP